MSAYEVEHEQPANILAKRLAQAQAIVVLIGGEGLETFSSMNDELRSNVVMTLETLIDDAIVAKDRVLAARAGKFGDRKSAGGAP